MILSDKHKFIFLKTKKTAGTSIEIELSSLLEREAVVTPFGVSEADHQPRNYQGFWNPIFELMDPKISTRKTIGDFFRRKRFYNHIPAHILRYRVGRKRWRTYYKFCVERDYVTKTKSHINMHIFKGRCSNKDEYFQKQNYCLNNVMYTIDGEVVVNKIICFQKLDQQLKELLESLGVKGFDGVHRKAKGKINKENIKFETADMDRLKQIFKDELKTLQKCKDLGIYSE